ncbi:MAG: murein L,D-transpeptidase catalytic domain family protein [Ginsengibacter sp.]
MKPDSKTVSAPLAVTNESSAFSGKVIHPCEKASVYDSLKLGTVGLSKKAFDNALKGFNYLRSMGKLKNDNILSIVDFSLPSSKKRLFVIDLINFKLLFYTYVAHGRNSGKETADEFSNEPESFKSSLGFYVTKDTYNGAHGFSLHLEGEEKGINDNAYRRSIVMHSAAYVDENVVKSLGFLGRSLGCPALSPKVYKPIIEKIKNGSCLFLYSPNPYYISHSQLLSQS